MSHFMKIPVLLSVLLLLLSACTSTPKTVVTIEQDTRCAPLKLAPGQRVVVMLPSNPTTGYRWEILNSAASVLEALGPEVYNNPKDSGLVGETGVSIWRYRVTRAGTDELNMVYQRPWEEQKPQHEFKCAIQVR